MLSTMHRLIFVCIFSITFYPFVQNAITSKQKRSFIPEETIKLENFESGPSECIFMKLDEGTYEYRTEGNQYVCGLYIIGDPNSIISFSYEYIDIDCSQGSQIEYVDGWELNGQLFPALEDGPVAAGNRVSTYCARGTPTKKFVTSQNVGLIRFKFASPGEGFQIRVTFMSNPTPCNVMLTQPSGAYTISNYGQRMNCSLSVMSPAVFKVLKADSHLAICKSPAKYLNNALLEISKKHSFISDLMSKSYGYLNKISGEDDCIEFRGGSNLDPTKMALVPFSASNKVKIACQNSAIRLVTSGFKKNYLTVKVEMLQTFKSPDLFCPSLLEQFNM